MQNKSVQHPGVSNEIRDHLILRFNSELSPSLNTSVLRYSWAVLTPKIYIIKDITHKQNIRAAQGR